MVPRGPAIYGLEARQTCVTLSRLGGQQQNTAGCQITEASLRQFSFFIKAKTIACCHTSYAAPILSKHTAGCSETCWPCIQPCMAAAGHYTESCASHTGRLIVPGIGFICTHHICTRCSLFSFMLICESTALLQSCRLEGHPSLDVDAANQQPMMQPFQVGLCRLPHRLSQHHLDSWRHHYQCLLMSDMSL